MAITTVVLPYNCDVFIRFIQFSENPQHSRDLEKMLMELNRGVVLECPQLDIVWLNGEFCQERLPAGYCV